MAKTPKWIIPSKIRGDNVYPHTMYWDDYLIQAAREIAEEVKDSLGRERLGPTIVIYNLSTQRGEYWTALRKRLKTRTEQLKKEDTHHVNHTQTAQKPVDT